MASFEPLLHIFLLIWIDDVLLCTKGFEDLLTRLEELFVMLRKFNLKINP
jgi:hypothetical protein